MNVNLRDYRKCKTFTLTYEFNYIHIDPQSYPIYRLQLMQIDKSQNPQRLADLTYVWTKDGVFG